MTFVFFATFIVVALVMMYTVFYYAAGYDPLNPDRFSIEDPNPIDLPELEVLLKNPHLLEALAGQVTTVGLIHNAETALVRVKPQVLTNNRTAMVSVSEIFIVRVDGYTQTLNKAPQVDSTVELRQEELAHQLADALGVPIHIA